MKTITVYRDETKKTGIRTVIEVLPDNFFWYDPDPCNNEGGYNYSDYNVTHDGVNYMKANRVIRINDMEGKLIAEW